MRTVDTITCAAAPDRLFQVAADVERWPQILPHYRWVRFIDRRPDGGIVEMAAWRPFRLFQWPTWWRSEMWIDTPAREVRYRHIAGVTTGMDVVWRVTPRGNGSFVELIHEWRGPRWPLIGRFAADAVIGPVFVHGIAIRTLAGVARHATEHPAHE